MKTEYPFYKKDNCHYFKVRENDCIVVCTKEIANISIQVLHKEIAEVTETVNCAEAEFIAAFYEVRKKLDDICLIKID